MGIPSLFRGNKATRSGAGSQSSKASPTSVTPLGDGVKQTSFGKIPTAVLVSDRGAGDGSESPRSSMMPVADLVGVEVIAFEVFGQGAFRQSRAKDKEIIHWTMNTRVPVSLAIIEMIWKFAEDRGGKLWTDADIDALKVDLTRWNHAQDLLAEYSYANIGLLFRKRMDAISAGVANGESPGPDAILNRQDAELQISEYRKAVRQGLGEVSRRVYERLLPKCERMQRAASELASLKASEEREASAKLELPFQASATLKALLFMAMAGSFDEVSNYFPGFTASLAPGSKFFGVTVVEFKQSGVAKELEEERKRVSEAVDRAVAENKARIARKQQQDLAAMDETSRAQVAKLNELHDALRQEGETAREQRVKSRIQTVRIETP